MHGKTMASINRWIACALVAGIVPACTESTSPGKAGPPPGKPSQPASRATGGGAGPTLEKKTGGGAGPTLKKTGGGAGPLEKKVFQSSLAGQWYPADKEALANAIGGYLEEADTPPFDNVQALILPHAGYRYSGPVAAYGIKTAAGKEYRRVIVMGPTHRMPMEGIASVPDGPTHYATPLGEVPLDLECIEALKKHPEFHTVPGAHQQEHSVQIELPLLQQALGTFTFVPIVVGQLEAPTARKMAQILAGLVGPETLVVASSDFTHYGANFDYIPFTDNVQANLEKLDMGAWAFIEKKDVDGFSGYLEKTGATICGRHPISILLAMLPPESAAHLLKYDTSGRMTHDNANSVSYLAIAFTGAWEKCRTGAPAGRNGRKGEPMETQDANTETLSDNDKEQLLKLARGTIEYYFKNGRTPAAPSDLGIEITPGMKQTMGAFVTLKKNGQLRGCIGEIIPTRPLYQAVIAQAVNAAVRDPRFPEVEQAELPEISIEISALTPSKPVDSYNDIVIGKHGMTLEKRGRRAVFLPQVAPEQGWDLDQTLTYLATKAGLAPDDWKQGAKFTVFEAIVFHEEEK